MNLSYLSFYSQYVNSPITNFHNINIIYKISTIFLISILIPYLNNISNIYYYIIFTYLFLLKRNIIYMILYICLYMYSGLKYIDIYSCLYLYIPYKIKIIFINQNIYFIEKICIKYHTCILPKFLLKTITIYLINIKLIQILFKYTKYEAIILFFLNLLYKINILRKQTNSYFLVTLSFTSQFLERITYNIHIIYISINLRYNYFFKKHFTYIIIYKLIYKLISNISNDTNNITLNLWNREIIIKNFYK